MRLLITIMMLALLSCEKTIEVELPVYEKELVMEMYLEEGQPLRCLLHESLPYTDTAINKPVDSALVIFSDGKKNDTLRNRLNHDPVTGRVFNYFNPRVVTADPEATYSLTIIGNGKKITSTTKFSKAVTNIDSLSIRESVYEADSFSVGLVITDAAEIENYYRFIIGRGIKYLSTNPTDFRISDLSFNGQRFSFFSEPDFARNDTVTVRVYSLNKEYYQYLESIGDARRSNYNPFSQPSRIKTNIRGGLGIFTAIRYAEKKIIIK